MLSIGQSTVHMFGKTYRFECPVSISGNVFPLVAILDNVGRRSLSRVFGLTDEENPPDIINLYSDILYSKYHATHPINVDEIWSLLEIYGRCLKSDDKRTFIETDSMRAQHIDQSEIIRNIFRSNPDIDIRTYLRQANLELNKQWDDRVLEGANGTYYIDRSYRDINDSTINLYIDWFMKTLDYESSEVLTDDVDD